jgi:hypothetical protein
MMAQDQPPNNYHLLQPFEDMDSFRSSWMRHVTVNDHVYAICRDKH